MAAYYEKLLTHLENARLLKEHAGGSHAEVDIDEL